MSASDPEPAQPAPPSPPPAPAAHPAPPPPLEPPEPPDPPAPPVGPPGLVYPAQIAGTDIPRRTSIRQATIARNRIVAVAIVVVLASTLGPALLGTLISSPDEPAATIPPPASPGSGVIATASAVPAGPTGSPTLESPPATATATPAPSAPAQATATASPGPAAGVATAGSLSYASAACFRVDAPDGKGGTTAGAISRFSVDLAVPAESAGMTTWLVVERTGIFEPRPILVKAAWKGARSWTSDRGLLVQGPTLAAGTTTLDWRLVFETPIDATYRLLLAATPAGTTRPPGSSLDERTLATWSLTTVIEACG